MSRSRREASQPVQLRAIQARKPLQERSRIRFEALLAATERLVEARDFSEISLYDIAEQAQTPPASVYHFFPTKEAAFVALAERHLTELARILNEPASLAGINGWQDLLAVRSERAVSYYNANPAFARIALSGSAVAEVRRLDTEYLSAIEHTPLPWLQRHLIMPYIPDAELKFTCLVGIYDGIWAASYSRHGRINEAFAREALRAVVGYCSSFLPNVISFREPALAADSGAAPRRAPRKRASAQ